MWFATLASAGKAAEVDWRLGSSIGWQKAWEKFGGGLIGVRNGPAGSWVVREVGGWLSTLAPAGLSAAA